MLWSTGQALVKGVLHLVSDTEEMSGTEEPAVVCSLQCPFGIEYDTATHETSNMQLSLHEFSETPDRVVDGPVQRLPT